MIHEEICTYEVAKLAKEKGFDWGCLCHYDCEGSLHQNYIYDYMNSGVSVDDHLLCNGHLDTSECLAPTQSLLQRWLREEKGIFISVEAYPPYATKNNIHYAWAIKRQISEHSMESYESFIPYSTYEKAFEVALKYAFENFV